MLHSGLNGLSFSASISVAVLAMTGWFALLNFLSLYFLLESVVQVACSIRSNLHNSSIEHYTNTC